MSHIKPLPLVVAWFIYAALLVALWFGFRHSTLGVSLGPEFTHAFASFALLFAPLWFFGFGAREPLRRCGSVTKIAAAGLLSLSYFAFAAGSPLFSWRAAVIVIAFPVLLSAFLELPKLPIMLTWRDATVLIIIAATYYLKLLQSAWPPELGLLPKLFLADVALYCFLVIRDLEGAGYSLVPNRSSFVIGMREWFFFFPIALLLGELTGFIHFHAAVPHIGQVIAALLLTFLLVAIPEELFFRAIIQNLLETRIGRTTALFVAAMLFGLSHFNHGAAFNWRYVLLASIAGIFYGRAWRANRQIFASIVTHTAVDVVWSLWFR
ncbi:MAG TPA: type II CAAX endopeptidase family protein [Terriglobales bacterium]|nr:type II CAAX endopeptidase family protein [Terriglobales bacterium]